VNARCPRSRSPCRTAPRPNAPRPRARRADRRILELLVEPHLCRAPDRLRGVVAVIILATAAPAQAAPRLRFYKGQTSEASLRTPSSSTSHGPTPGDSSMTCSFISRSCATTKRRRSLGSVSASAGKSRSPTEPSYSIRSTSSRPWMSPETIEQLSRGRERSRLPCPP